MNNNSICECKLKRILNFQLCPNFDFHNGCICSHKLAIEHIVVACVPHVLHGCMLYQPVVKYPLYSFNTLSVCMVS